MAKKRKRRKGSKRTGGKRRFGTASMVTAVLLAVVLTFCALRLVHKCDTCDKLFLGTGYKPNAAKASAGVRVVCKDCAAKQHAASAYFGDGLKEYRYGIFEDIW